MKKHQIVFLFLMLIWAGTCYVNEIKAESFTITKGGEEQLSSFFPETSKYFITDLKVVGEINTGDINFIRSIATGDGNLANLDLSEVTFVDAYGLGQLIQDYNIKKGTWFDYYSSVAQNFMRIPYFWHEYENNYNYNTYIGYYISYSTGFSVLEFGIVQHTGFDIIPNHIFRGCEKLRTVALPPHVTSIGDYAFYGCNNLEEVIIPANVKNIGDYSFKGCVNLREIEFPQALMSIGSSAFDGCTSLSSIVIPDNVNYMGSSVFQNCTGLITAKLTDSLEKVPTRLFKECSKLKSANIPQSCTEIQTEAFYCCALDSIIIPESVKFIDASAISFNPFSHGIYAMPPMPPSYGNKNSWGNVILYVPKGCVERYSLSPGWKEFKTILEMPEMEVLKCARPTISYVNGKLKFNCETIGVSFNPTIKDDDIKSYAPTDEIVLGIIYQISVYASKLGYEDSEVATGTLCWIDQQPSTEGIVAEDAVTEVKALPVLIQSYSGTITVQGANEGTVISVYSVNGMKQGSAIATNGLATINTSLQPGSTAIVKIGEKAIKVAMK